MKRIEEIDRLIKKTQAELNNIEEKKNVALEKLRRLQIQKNQLAKDTASVDFNGPKVTNSTPQAEKISLFRALFKGREDVFPKRYESAKSGRSGYTPNCKNEWVTRICEKPRIKCMDCVNRVFVPLSDTVIESHLKGYDISGYSNRDYTIGVYHLFSDETCWFLTIDFDKKAWADNVLSFLDT